MNILTVNTGSSSVRLAIFSVSNGRLYKTASERLDTTENNPEQQLNEFLSANKCRIDAVSHRVVHGGDKFTESCLINRDVEEEIDRLASVAPLHNPAALSWIRACKKSLSEKIPQAAVFDTAFFSVLPEIAGTYAIPKDLSTEYNIRRYGFHGIAHRAMSEQWQRLRPDLEKGGKAISLQLGSGCSATALKHGMPVDTSMGFSPNEGLVMSTRSGDIDSGAVLYLQKSAGFSAEEIDDILNNSSGLSGLSGISNDMKTLLDSDSHAAQLAVDLYCYRARKYIGAYMAALGGTDGILFGGGVGENAPFIRKRILYEMHWCGIKLDNHINDNTTGTGGRISSPESSVDVCVIDIDEAAVLAQEALTLVHEGGVRMRS